MDLTELYQLSDRLMITVPQQHVRPGIEFLEKSARFVGLRGARGVGKSTLLLQYGNQLRATLGRRVLYVSLDQLFFRKYRLTEFARHFVREGGQVLLLDEVHRYGKDWSVELKLLYDSFPELRVRFTSSSIVELGQARGDLSRRAQLRDVYGLSFREYLAWKNVANLPVYALDELIKQNVAIATEHLAGGFKPNVHFNEYLAHGYYPFYWDTPEDYHYLLNETINVLLEQDLPPVYNITPATAEKLKKLLIAIAESVPFSPNMTKLAAFLETSRPQVQQYLYYLHQAQLIGLLPKQVRGIVRTQKPEKIYLDNPNLLFSLPTGTPNVGTLRETFFYNALTTVGADLGYGKSGDFQTDRYLFEVGGRTKSNKQIAGQTNAYRVVADTDVGHGNRIPIWLFGLLR